MIHHGTSLQLGTRLEKNFSRSKIVNEIGYKKYKVLNYYKKSEIAGNSVWDEPLGRIAIEAY